jgi:hypothetical protein
MTDEINPVKNPLAAEVVTTWKALSKHANGCEQCIPLVKAVYRHNKFKPDLAEYCCEAGTLLVLEWRGAVDDLVRSHGKNHSGESDRK